MNTRLPENRTDDDRVGTALRALPRDAAGETFVEGVRDELGRRRRNRRRLTTGATLFAILVGVMLVGVLHQQSLQVTESERREAARARLELMIAQQQRLERELAELQRLTTVARPVVRLESTDQVDYVVDLARFAERPGVDRAELPQTATPAVLRQPLHN